MGKKGRKQKGFFFTLISYLTNKDQILKKMIFLILFHPNCFTKIFSSNVKSTPVFFLLLVLLNCFFLLLWAAPQQQQQKGVKFSFDWISAPFCLTNNNKKKSQVCVTTWKQNQESFFRKGWKTWQGIWRHQFRKIQHLVRNYPPLA